MVPGFNTDLLARRGIIGVAVSAGADSVGLLHLLQDLQLPLIILHVNHKLRAVESDLDQEFVSQKAADLGLPVLTNAPDLSPGNLEQAARNARYRWFNHLIETGAVTQVATGHTADDQAETVLFRFLRGAGTAGLAGIRPVLKPGIVRPLLGATRASLRRYLESRGIAWREDSSNAQVRFARNRIRMHLLPQLEREWNPALSANLSQTALWAQDEEAFWEAELPQVTANWVRFAENEVFLNADRLNGLPAAVARRVVRWAVERVNGRGRQLGFAHVEGIRRLAVPPSGSGSFRAAGIEARRSFAEIRISPAVHASPVYRRRLSAPGSCPVPGQASTLRLELKPIESVYNDDGQQVDWGLVSGSLELRNWEPGDQYTQAGHASAEKLKRYFQKAGIPFWERSGWPVITCANSILWARGLGAAAGFSPTPKTKTVLLIHEVREERPNRKVLL
ncbi:MAG: tRNA lysidine(34) synthetase TilS [Acidobacteriota bacterium]|nr:tRNA lysidine(34) synthetase TilS [Acidobacteriota bacterium]